MFTDMRGIYETEFCMKMPAARATLVRITVQDLTDDRT